MSGKVDWTDRPGELPGNFRNIEADDFVIITIMNPESVQSRNRRQPHHERAYDVQFAGGVKGAIQWTIGGAAACAFAHWYFPLFRRQTLAFKAFLTSSCTVAGLVVGADTHLLKYEAQRRREENAIRRIGQIELGKQGIIASETEYRKWRAMYDEQLGMARAQRDKDAASRQSPPLGSAAGVDAKAAAAEA